MEIIEHAESFEARPREGESRFFYFCDDTTRREMMRRMTREQARRAAQAYAGGATIVS